MSFRPLLTPLRNALWSLLLAPLFFGSPVAAQNNSPATPVPAARWGLLEPRSILSDISGWDGHREPTPAEPVFQSVQIEGDFLFATTGRGLQIYDVGGSPAAPALRGYGYAATGDRNTPSVIPSWQHSDKDFFLRDVSVPVGDDRVAVVAGEEQGFIVFDTTVKTNPVGPYQDLGASIKAVHATVLGSKPFGFAATGSEIRYYDLNAALAVTDCTDLIPSDVNCPGVYKGKLATAATALDGVGSYLAVANGSKAEIWDVAAVASGGQASKVLNYSGSARSVALWKVGSTYYMALLQYVSQQNVLSIFNVSCIASGSCAAVSPLVTAPVPAPLFMSFLTFSEDGGKRYLFAGGADVGSCAVQREYLFDVTIPSAPVELTPQTHPSGYWGWYYPGCTTGFRYLTPYSAAVKNGHIYRAAYSLLDVHEIVGAQVPVADFSWSPAAPYAGEAISFTDLSSGAPSDWSWTFGGGSPASSFTANPSGVVFATPGAHSVSLIAGNDAGSDTKIRTVTVQDPAPTLTSVTASPTAPYQCQPITLTANGGGRSPLTHSWTIRDASSGIVHQEQGQQITWNTSANVPAGNYSAEVMVANTAGNTSGSVPVTLAPLPTLPASGSFAPTNDPFSAGVVSFHVAVPGATEWSWDFGSGFGAYSNDPVTGPNPTHTYTTVGLKTVRVKIKNCLSGEVTSANLQINITQIVPLNAQFAPAGVFCSGGLCFVSVNETVSFNDSSTGAEFWDYDWDGNGSYEDAGNTAAKLSHAFTSTGTVTPKLRVRRGANEEDVAASPLSFAVAPASPPSISISGSSSVTVNQAANYSASASNCTPSATWNWTAAGGTVNGSGASVSVTFTSTGTKNLSVTNSGCAGASGSKNISVGGGGGGPDPDPDPGGTLTAAFTFTPAAPTPGQAITFNGSSSSGSPSGYVWTFSDGETQQGAIVTKTFASAGNHTATLNVTKPGNCFSGLCIDDLTKTVAVGGGGPSVGAAYSTSASCTNEFGLVLCTASAGQTVTFTDTSQVSNGTVTAREWTFGDGGTASGASVSHVWTGGGTFQVQLTVTAGTASDSTIKNFQVSGEPAPEAAFSTDACGASSSGICEVFTDQEISFTNQTAGPQTLRAWHFGDDEPVFSLAPQYTWTSPGTYVVKLEVWNNDAKGKTEQTFVVTESPRKEHSLVLPWVADLDGAVAQANDLEIYNPDAGAVSLELTFLRRGWPEETPPTATLTVSPGATERVEDVLPTLFDVDGQTGLILARTTSDNKLAPVVRVFNRTLKDGGVSFRMALPSVLLSDAAAAATQKAGTVPPGTQHLVGLVDTDMQRAFFGISNPTDAGVSYRLRAFDADGDPLGPASPPLTLPRNSQKQFQARELDDLFALDGLTDYRVEVETIEGGPVFAWATNVRQESQDPSFVAATSDLPTSKWLLGVQKQQQEGASWVTDVLLTNPGEDELEVTLGYREVGVKGSFKDAEPYVLGPGESRRVSDVVSLWPELGNGSGVLRVVESDGSAPVLVQAETYDASKTLAETVGEVLPVLSTEDVAGPKQSSFLLGLRAEGQQTTSTLWLFNPSSSRGVYQIFYRSLDGKLLRKVKRFAVPPGRVRSVSNHRLPAGETAFTVEVYVKRGELVAAGEVMDQAIGDPTFVVGDPR